MWGRTRSALRGNPRFEARRRLRRRRVLIISGILSVGILIGGIYLLNRDFARITSVEVAGADQSLAAIVQNAMQGSYLGIIPRNSTLFYPGNEIRAAILARDTEVAAVSLYRRGLTGLTVRANPRIPIARWCGATLPVTRNDYSATSTGSNLVTPDCFYFDAGGVVYATSTADQPVNTFDFYEPLESTAGVPVFGTSLPNAHSFPSAFDFARQLGAFGSSVTIVVFREGEVDDYLRSGTRITYVRGNEQNAFTALASAQANVNLADGSIEYVDLRFDGKVYLKRKDDKVK